MLVYEIKSIRAHQTLSTILALLPLSQDQVSGLAYCSSRGLPKLIIALAVLILLDRNLDLIPMVAHSWSYQALVSDVLDIKLNRVAVDVGFNSQRS